MSNLINAAENLESVNPSDEDANTGFVKTRLPKNLIIFIRRMDIFIFLIVGKNITEISFCTTNRKLPLQIYVNLVVKNLIKIL